MAGLILAISLATLGQFILLYWRSVLNAAAAIQLAEGMDALEREEGCDAAFSWNEMCPNIVADSDAPAWRMLWARTYYRAVDMAGRLTPSLKQWAASEMTACTRYAAVLVSERVESNRRYAAAMLA